MSVVAFITWICTAALGLFLLSIWLIEYDREFQEAAATRLPIPVISAHAMLALIGLVLWAGYLIGGSRRLAWAAIVILAAVASLGAVMAVRWVGVYRSFAASTAAEPGSARPAPPIPPERNFPVPVVIAHGIAAVVTVALVLITVLLGVR